MLDRMLGFLAKWRGLPALIGVLLVALSFIASFAPGASWLTWHDWLLHLGIIVAVLGVLLGEVL
jgi:protein-S-isoprenylcysteine O-methyltransferase Ste14